MTRLLQDWATRQVERRPDATAVVMRGRRLSYSEVEQASNRLARMLHNVGCTKGDRVCLLAPKSPDAIVAIHAILKAGCLVVPMDAQSPAPRLAKIIEACGPRLILASAATIARLGELRSISDRARCARIGYLEVGIPDCAGIEVAFRPEDVAGESPEPEDRGSGGADPAYLLFTSGSTGTPKGVVVTHANVVGFVDWAGDYFDLGPSDRISQHPPLHFDLSIFDIFGASAAGAELHLVPPETNLRPDRLTEFIRDSALTQWFSVPSVLGYLAKFDVVGQGDFPLLKRLLWCGEVLPTPTLVHFMRRLPHVQFTNLYGPTEATIASSYYTVPSCPEDPAAAIPIGRPCGGEDLLVLDGNLDPVGPGVAGDLYIRGIGLSPGYWEDRNLTRAAFLDGPPVRSRHARIYKTGDLARIGENGLIYFLGRADSQIKSRGYRIELGEIEAALETVGQLSAVAVVAIDAGGFEGAMICCAYEPKNGAEVTARSLRAALGTKLPSYMIPTRWLAFDTLPKTANGKVDRQRLREEAKGWPLGRIAAAAAPGPRAGEGALASSGADEGV